MFSPIQVKFHQFLAHFQPETSRCSCARVSNEYLQILLVLYHSTPTRSNMLKMQEFVERNLAREGPGDARCPAKIFSERPLMVGHELQHQPCSS